MSLFFRAFFFIRHGASNEWLADYMVHDYLMNGIFFQVFFIVPSSQDESVKQILLFLDSKMHFIIEDLDARHLFVESAQIESVRKALERILAENTFVREDTIV